MQERVVTLPDRVLSMEAKMEEPRIPQPQQDIKADGLMDNGLWEIRMDTSRKAKVMAPA
jgi:hypothetical protein